MRACMVAYTGYDSDNRVLRYAETLARHGYKVDAVVLRGEGQPEHEVVNGVRIFRIQRRVRNEKSRLGYLGKLLLFFFRSMFFLTWEQFREPYDLIHVHTVPDFEVFAALIPRLTGSKIILDIHDILPEFYASKFNVSTESLTFRLMVAMERMSIAFSDHVIAANHLWEKRLIGRSVKPSKCTTFLNFPDTRILQPRGRNRNDGKFIILYPGTLTYHQGLDIALRAFSLISQRAPEAEFHMYGFGDQMEYLKSLISELGLEKRVFLKAPMPLRQISSVIENSDLGIVPKRKDSFGNEAFSTKILEFMSLGVPVIVSDTTIDTYYFNNSIVQFFQANDERSLADAMLLLIKNADLRKSLVTNANEFIKKYTWDTNQGTYLELVRSLVRSSG
jgi:glycosyltransferase involved in cell wall biosynthesis